MGQHVQTISIRVHRSPCRSSSHQSQRFQTYPSRKREFHQVLQTSSISLPASMISSLRFLLSSMAPKAPSSQTKQSRAQVEPKFPQTPAINYELPAANQIQSLDDAGHRAKHQQSSPGRCKQTQQLSREPTSPRHCQRQRHRYGERAGAGDHKVVHEKRCLGEGFARRFSFQTDVPAGRPDHVEGREDQRPERRGVGSPGDARSSVAGHTGVRTVSFPGA